MNFPGLLFLEIKIIAANTHSGQLFRLPGGLAFRKHQVYSLDIQLNTLKLGKVEGGVVYLRIFY